MIQKTIAIFYFVGLVKNPDRHEAVGVDHWDGLVTSVAWGWTGTG